MTAMRRAIILAALVGCSAPEPGAIEAESDLTLICYDGTDCTADVLVSGVAGNFCQYKPLPGGTPCAEGHECAGTCFPPRLESDGSVTPGECDCRCFDPHPCDRHECGVYQWCGRSVECGSCNAPETCLYDDGLFACIR